ncbi:hypothetical protein HYZ99_01370 [Candidatus Peregrinibacteria bacterium]|nr:hypothetical protein [Candidatus Peregrinibacteria bacterium]
MSVLPLSSAKLPLGEILRRAAVPFALFSGVLAGLLTLSWFLLLPIFTRIEVSGAQRDVAALLQYRAELQAQLVAAEESRAATLIPERDASYEDLKRLKRERPSLLRLRDQFLSVAAGIVEQHDAVHIRALHLREDGTLEMSGDVRFVGPRSMTVLAEFIEEIADIPAVAAVSLPRYVREEDLRVGPHSPFTVTITLR